MMGRRAHESQMFMLRESGPSLRRPSRQCSTTRLWPQLLSKWQTVWQRQVVGNLSPRPLKQAAPGPSLQTSERQTSDKQVFVLDHVVPSSPFLFSPPLVLTCVRGQLCYGLTGSAIVFSIQKRQIGVFCWTSLISSSFNVVSHCKTVTLALLTFDFFQWAPFIKLLDYESSERQYFFILYRCAVVFLSLDWDGFGEGGSDPELTSDHKFATTHAGMSEKSIRFTKGAQRTEKQNNLATCH